MRLVIEASDFRRLSPDTQKELIRHFAGRNFLDAREGKRRSNHEWREPIDINRDLTRQLMHGLADNHRRRLQEFTRHGGRVTVKQLLKPRHAATKAAVSEEDMQQLRAAGYVED